MQKYLELQLNIFAFFAHYKNIMIYIFSLISGIINGVFASGAGQILIVYLIFILKEKTHLSRTTSIIGIGTVTIFTMFRYIKLITINWQNIVITIISGIIFGAIGSKLMQKIPSKILNISSGIIIVIFSIYNLVVR